MNSQAVEGSAAAGLWGATGGGGRRGATGDGATGGVAGGGGLIAGFARGGGGRGGAAELNWVLPQAGQEPTVGGIFSWPQALQYLNEAILPKPKSAGGE